MASDSGPDKEFVKMAGIVIGALLLFGCVMDSTVGMGILEWLAGVGK